MFLKAVLSKFIKALNHRSFTPLVLIFILLIVGVFARKVFMQKPMTSDFDIFYLTSQRIKVGAIDDIYLIPTDGTGPFRYTPASLSMFQPLIYFSYATSKMIWFFTQLFFFSWSFKLIKKVLKPFNKTAFFLAFALVFRYILDSLYAGQPTGIIFFGFTLALYGWIKNKYFLTGVGIGLGFVFKVGPIIALLPIVFCSSLLGTLLSLSGFGFIFSILSFRILQILGFAPDILNQYWRDWIHATVSTPQFIEPKFHKIQSLLSFYARAGSGLGLDMAAVHLIWKSSLIVGLLGLSFYWLKHRKLSLSQKALNYGLALLGYIWFMPESQKHSYSYLFLPLFLICDSAFPLGKSGNPFAKALFLLTVIVFILCSPGFIGEEWSRNVSLLSIPLITTFFMATFLILNREQASKD